MPSKTRRYLVTQEDVARKANVALSSVSFVVNGHFHLVSEVPLARIRAAIAELGYQKKRVRGTDPVVFLPEEIFTWMREKGYTDMPLSLLLEAWKEGLVNRMKHIKE